MLEKLNKSAENKGTTQINYGCIRKQTKNNNERGNEKRGKKPKLMVQQPAREAMEKNKKRVQQLVGKEIHRPDIDKVKEKAFGCKLKKIRHFQFLVTRNTKDNCCTKCKILSLTNMIIFPMQTRQPSSQYKNSK